MLEDKEKKTDEKVDAQPASDEKEKSQTRKEAECIHKLTQVLKSAEDVVDEMLAEGSTTGIAILGLLIASFYDHIQDKTMVVLKRDPKFKAISDKIDAEYAAKRKKEAAE